MKKAVFEKWGQLVACVIVGFVGISSEPLDAADVERRPGTLADAQMADLLGKHDEVELSKYQRIVRLAEDAMERGEDSKAFESLNEARRLEPNSSAAYVVYAKLHLKREEYASAEKAAKFATTVAPEDSSAWFQHSRIQALKGENDVAIQAARQAVTYMIDPRWDYQKWLGELLLEAGKPESAEERFVQAASMLEGSLGKLNFGIQSEERKREVVGIHQETELVAGLNGTVTEIPVTRLEKEYKNAPDEWYAMKDFFTEQLGEIHFSRFQALVAMNRAEEARGLLADIFQKGTSFRGNAQYAFAMRDFTTVASSLEAAHAFWAEASDSEIAAYVVSLSSSSDGKRFERSAKKLRKAIDRVASPWLYELMGYVKRYAPEMKSLPSRSSTLDEIEKANLEFYQAQFHFAQGYPGLAWPLLESSEASGLLEGFELKVAVVQLQFRD